MKTITWKSFKHHIIVLIVFFLVAIIYCKPSIEGKVLQQHDVTQWKGMAQNSMLYKEKHGNVPLWTNGMFSGMPSFQITGAGYNPISPGILLGILPAIFTKVVGFFILACICFYFLGAVLKVNSYISMFGALAFAYATYNPIIISAGHDTKMLAISLMPAFIASLLIIYEKKYLLGTALTALFTSLLIAVNHLQITYYSFLVAAIMSIGFGIQWIKSKDYQHLLKAAGMAITAAILGVLVNAAMLFSTYEYSKKTIRGGSELADEKSSITKTGLSNEYALSYSMYKTEPLEMAFPRIYGGASGALEIREESSKAISALQTMPQQLGQQLQGFLNFYWGGIGNTSGPAYLGAIVCFLALIGFVILDDKYKWWILAASVLTLMMSWGKYFEGFNILLLKYLPFYNKFRAPSMILVVPSLLLSMMSVLTLEKIFSSENKLILFQQYKKGLLLVVGLFILAIGLYFSADFTSESDKALIKQVTFIQDLQQRTIVEQYVESFVDGLKEDRKSLFIGDLLRSLFFMSVAAISLLLYIKKKMSVMAATFVIGIATFLDIMLIDIKYLNEDQYQNPEEYENNFQPTAIDQQILKDTSYYRVFDVSHGVGEAFNSGALTSYFHKSIGGYHPAKLSIYQDVIENQLYNFPNCMPVLNMLNTKYIIFDQQQNGQGIKVQQNPEALGAAWFVRNIVSKSSSAEIMRVLTSLNAKDTAVILDSDVSNYTASPIKDSSAFIHLVFNDNDIIKYQSFSKSKEFAVFSEVFYEAGWQAKIDGQLVPIVRTNYVLRGLQIPSGKHEIVFEFKPSSVEIGSKASLFASIIIWLLLLSAILVQVKSRNV